MYVCLYVSLLILHHLKRKISKVWAEYVSVLNAQILKKRLSLQLTKIISSLQIKYSPCFPYILMKRKKNFCKVFEQLHLLKFSSSSVSYTEKLNTLKRIMETVNPFHKQFHSPVLCSCAASKHTQTIQEGLQSEHTRMLVNPSGCYPIPLPLWSFAKASQNP